MIQNVRFSTCSRAPSCSGSALLRPYQLSARGADLRPTCVFTRHCSFVKTQMFSFAQLHRYTFTLNGIKPPRSPTTTTLPHLPLRRRTTRMARASLPALTPTNPLIVPPLRPITTTRTAWAPPVPPSPGTSAPNLIAPASTTAHPRSQCLEHPVHGERAPITTDRGRKPTAKLERPLPPTAKSSPPRRTNRRRPPSRHDRWTSTRPCGYRPPP